MTVLCDTHIPSLFSLVYTYSLSTSNILKKNSAVFCNSNIVKKTVHTLFTFLRHVQHRVYHQQVFEHGSDALITYTTVLKLLLEPVSEPSEKHCHNH